MPSVLNFYVNQLGMKQLFTLNREGSDEPWFEFVGINNHQTIEFIYGATVDVPDDWNSAGTLHVCYNCPDLEETVEKLRAAGVPVIIEPNIGVDGNAQAWVTDPQGRRVELMREK